MNIFRWACLWFCLVLLIGCESTYHRRLALQSASDSVWANPAWTKAQLRALQQENNTLSYTQSMRIATLEAIACYSLGERISDSEILRAKHRLWDKFYSHRHRLLARSAIALADCQSRETMQALQSLHAAIALCDTAATTYFLPAYVLHLARGRLYAENGWWEMAATELHTARDLAHKAHHAKGIEQSQVALAQIHQALAKHASREIAQREAPVRAYLSLLDEQKQTERAYMLALVACGLLLLYLQYRSQQQYEAQNEHLWQQRQAYATLMSQLSSLEQNAQAAETEINALRQQVAQYHEVPTPPSSELLRQLQHAPIVAQLHKKAAKAQAITLNEMEQLLQLFADVAPDFLLALPNIDRLTLEEQVVCCWVKLLFLPAEISVLLDTTPQHTTNLRARLCYKVFGHRAGAKGFDQRIGAHPLQAVSTATNSVIA